MPEQKRLRDNPWVVLFLLFAVLGPFGLPMLWSSRGFSRWARIGLTVAVLGIAGYAIWYVYATVYGPVFKILDDLNKI